jgi:putative ABC transport system permease protein
MNNTRLALRFLWRDLARSETRLLALALVLAVMTVSIVTLFVERARSAMETEAAALIAADLVLESRDPIPEMWRERAHALGIQTAELLEFPSVVSTEHAMQLVQVRAVGEGYPLRGEQRSEVWPDVTKESTAAASALTRPLTGKVWSDPRLPELLRAEGPFDGRLQLGKQTLELERVIVQTADQAASLFRLSPRILVAIENIEATGLLGPASRIRYQLLLAGEADSLATLRREVERFDPEARSIEVEDVRSSRPVIRDALDRVEQLLRLAAASALLLSLIAVLLASRRFSQRQMDMVALLRTLGTQRAQLMQLLSLRLFALGLVASLIGLFLAWTAQPILLWVIEPRLNWQWATLDLYSVTMGLLTGLLLLLGAALPQLLQLVRTPPLRILRREFSGQRQRLWEVQLPLLLALGLLLMLQLGHEGLALRFLGGLVFAWALFAGLAAALVALLRPLRKHTGGSWRYGLANLSRHPQLTTLQLSGFGLGLSLLLLLGLVRTDLLEAWQDTLPAGTPNQFLINIQPEEVIGLNKALTDLGLELKGPYPMVRARFITLNGEAVREEQFTPGRAQRLALRDFNLSWSAILPIDNTVIAGQWDAEGWSVEAEFAETLGLHLGDQMTFEIAGSQVSAPITSLRNLSWDSFQPNFFVLGSPELLQTQPATFISSFFQQPQQASEVRRILRDYPSVTALDLDALLGEVRAIIGRGARAIEFIAALTLLAGGLVLAAGLQATRDLRLQEVAVLRTLGISRALLRRAVWAEFAVLGGLAGILGAGVATAISASLAKGVFQLPWSPNVSLWLIAVPLSVLALVSLGWRLTRSTLNTPPLQLLRQL